MVHFYISEPVSCLIFNAFSLWCLIMFLVFIVVKFIVYNLLLYICSDCFEMFSTAICSTQNILSFVRSSLIRTLQRILIK